MCVSRSIVFDPFDESGNGLDLAELSVCFSDSKLLLEHAEDLGLLDGVDSKVGLEFIIEIDVVDAIARLLCNDLDDLL